MGKGAGGGKEKVEPWGPQQPYLEHGFQRAKQLLNQPREYYPGQTVAPFAPQQEMGLDMLQQRAMQGSPVNMAAQNWATGMMQGGGMSGGMAGNAGNLMNQVLGSQPTLGGTQGYTGADAAQHQGGLGAIQAGMGGGLGLGQATDYFAQPQMGLGGSANFFGGQVGPYQQGLAQQGGPSLQQGADFFNQAQGQTNLAQTAGGQFLGANPYLEDMAGKATEVFKEQMMPELNATFGAGGRTGGGLHAMAAGRAMGDMGEAIANIYGQEYSRERDRMAQAGGQQAQLGLAGQQGAADLYNQGAGRGLQGLQSAGQLGLGSAQGAAGLYGSDADRALRGRGMAMDTYNTGISNLMQGGRDMMSDELARRQLGSNIYGQQLGFQGDVLGQFGQMYGQDLAARQAAAGMAPQLAQTDYQDINAMLQGGQITQQQAQRLMDDLKARHDFYQMEPERALRDYMQAISGQYGSVTQQGGGFGNTLGGIMQGAATGAQFGGPIGGVLGGLAGIFI